MTPHQTVEHDPSNHRFVIDLSGQPAIADYTIDRGNITFTHTFVPESARGRGLATLLVRTALDDARARGLQVVPQCPMFAAYIKAHPKPATCSRRPRSDCWTIDRCSLCRSPRRVGARTPISPIGCRCRPTRRSPTFRSNAGDPVPGLLGTMIDPSLRACIRYCRRDRDGHDAYTATAGEPLEVAGRPRHGRCRSRRFRCRSDLTLVQSGPCSLPAHASGLIPGRGPVEHPTKEITMKNVLTATAVAFVLAVASTSVQAKGCITGAAVGGVAGHVAGHHGLIGAAAGCAINHHRNTVKDRNAAAAAAQPAQPAPATPAPAATTPR